MSKVSRLLYRNNRFIFQCSYQDRVLAEKAGFQWHTRDKCWYTDLPKVADSLRNYADEKTNQALDNLLIRVQPWTDPLPSLPPGKNYLKHLKKAVRFVLERNRSYLRLDPGLGKTFAAVMAARGLRMPVLYICPAFLVRNVEEEFRKWAPGLSPVIYSGEKNQLEMFALFKKSVLIFPDSQLDKLWHYINAMWKNVPDMFLVVDEAHRYKNPDAQRTQFMLGHVYLKKVKGEQRKKRVHIPGIKDSFSRQVYLSGTPMPNRPMELWPLLNAVAPETIDNMSQFAYGRKFCDGKLTQFGWDFSGASKMKQLSKRLKKRGAPFMLDMRDDILDLPPLTEEIFVVSDDMSPKLAKMDKRLSAVYGPEDIIKSRIAAKAGKNKDKLATSTYRRFLGMEKVPAAVEYIHYIMQDTDQNVILFAHHEEVIDALTSYLTHFHPIVIGGSVKLAPAKRQTLVDRFNASKKLRLMIGSQLMMGIGYNITKADLVIFLEPDWVPGNITQGFKRAHRLGRKLPVKVQHMVFRGSLDKAIIETVIGKRDDIKHI